MFIIKLIEKLDNLIGLMKHIFYGIWNITGWQKYKDSACMFLLFCCVFFISFFLPKMIFGIINRVSIEPKTEKDVTENIKVPKEAPFIVSNAIKVVGAKKRVMPVEEIRDLYYENKTPIFPNVVVSGLILSEDTETENPWDVKLSAGVLFIDGDTKKVISKIKSCKNCLSKFRKLSMMGWYMEGMFATSVDSKYWAYKGKLVKVNPDKYYKSYFILRHIDNSIIWIYPHQEFDKESEAIASKLIKFRPELTHYCKLKSVVMKGDAVKFPGSVSDSWQDLRPMTSQYQGVTDHSNLTGLEEDDGHLGWYYNVNGDEKITLSDDTPHLLHVIYGDAKGNGSGLVVDGKFIPNEKLEE